MSPERAISGVPTPVRNLYKRIGGTKLAAAAGAVVLTMTLAVGAGAAPSPVDPVADVLGISNHGPTVSQAVHDAQTEAKEAGEDVGAAVSLAACEAAHDRTTLPEGAQNAPGQVDREPKDCTADDEETANDDEDVAQDAVTDETDADTQDEDTDTHGSVVSQAVHDAQTAAKDAGENVGAAVSQAACEAAHDRSTLPDGAQNAPGQQDREAKDCTHPSNVDDGGEPEPTGDDSSSQTDSTHGNSGNHGNSGSHGKDSAPGQQKKNGN
jgi:hypothetical protein